MSRALTGTALHFEETRLRGRRWLLFVEFLRFQHGGSAQGKSLFHLILIPSDSSQLILKPSFLLPLLLFEIFVHLSECFDERGVLLSSDSDIGIDQIGRRHHFHTLIPGAVVTRKRPIDFQLSPTWVFFLIQTLNKGKIMTRKAIIFHNSNVRLDLLSKRVRLQSNERRERLGRRQRSESYIMLGRRPENACRQETSATAGA